MHPLDSPLLELPVAIKRSYSTTLASATLAILAAAPALRAQDSYIVGPRALAMGGANVAVTDDYTAQFYNPAAFGFFGDRDAAKERIGSDNNDIGRKYWGFGVDVAASEHIQGKMGTYLDDLSRANDISSAGIQNQQDLEDLVRIADSLEHVADSGNALSSDVTTGVGVRVGSFGLGARGYFQATGRVDSIDTTRIGFSTPITDADIGNFGDGTVVELNGAQVTQLTTATGGGGAGLNNVSVETIDFTIRQQGLTQANDAASIQLLVNGLVQTNTGANNFSNNQTVLTVKGFGLGEVPLTYGHSLGDHLSVGASLKLMIGRVYGTTVRVFDDDADQILENADENYKQSINVGVDIGVMARMPMLQAGLTLRNLNSPSFKGPTIVDATTGNTIRFSDVRLDPQATLGVAFVPFTTLAIEVDCDLNPAETTFVDYQTQRLSAGIEWNAARIIALRAGVYKNLAETDVPVVFSGGIGLNLYVLRLDLAAAASPETDTFDGESYPKEARVAFALAVDF
jgi:hypothetical protein